jgi:tetratricopeptide (TPR) repeat protein
LKLIKEFSLTLLYLAETMLSLGAYKEAIFYYNQSRISAKSQMNYPVLIDSFIGLAKCCSKVSQHASGVLFLKKSLEYTWHIGDREKELIIYDEIGYKYYMMGQLKQAQFYHERHGTGGFERDSSAVKAMVRAKMKAEEEKNKRNRITSIDRLFLAALNIPIKELDELPSLVPDSLRSGYTNKLSQVFDPYGQPESQLRRILHER